MKNRKACLLYVKRAIRHLVKINAALKDLEAESNVNLMQLVSVIREERQCLLDENPNYFEAADILIDIGLWHQ